MRLLSELSGKKWFVWCRSFFLPDSSLAISSSARWDFITYFPTAGQSGLPFLVLLLRAPNTSLQLQFSGAASMFHAASLCRVEKKDLTQLPGCRSSLPKACCSFLWASLPCQHGSFLSPLSKWTYPTPLVFKWRDWNLLGAKMYMKPKVPFGWPILPSGPEKEINLFLLWGICSILQCFSLLKDHWDVRSQWLYNNDTVRVAISRDVCPLQEGFQVFWSG